jgi:DNA-binding transcriptional regulator YhcF (GntR family)
MPDAPSEPFHVVMRHLRDRLQRGLLPPGSHVTAVDLADELRLSTTPVREALSRLAGEDLLEERRGQGYFVRLLSAPDVADLYRVSLSHLLIAAEPRRVERAAAAAPQSAEPLEPVEAVEAMFGRCLRATGSRYLIRAFRLVQIQLGPVRRQEAAIFDDLALEAETLAAAESAGRGERTAQLRHFHARRIRDAARLAASLEGAAGASRK